MIRSLRFGMVADAVDLQGADLPELVVETFTAGQRKLAEAAEDVVPRLQAIHCGR